jgi:hypothetical protein
VAIRRDDLIHEHTTSVRTPEGQVFAVRTHGERREDGTWIAWLEFEPSDRLGVTLRTERETTQASRDALGVWASGLEAAYFEGAFARAYPVNRR